MSAFKKKKTGFGTPADPSSNDFSDPRQRESRNANTIDDNSQNSDQYGVTPSDMASQVDNSTLGSRSKDRNATSKFKASAALDIEKLRQQGNDNKLSTQSDIADSNNSTKLDIAGIRSGDYRDRTAANVNIGYNHDVFGLAKENVKADSNQAVAGIKSDAYKSVAKTKAGATMYSADARAGSNNYVADTKARSANFATLNRVGSNQSVAAKARAQNNSAQIKANQQSTQDILKFGAKFAKASGVDPKAYLDAQLNNTIADKIDAHNAEIQANNQQQQQYMDAMGISENARQKRTRWSSSGYSGASKQDALGLLAGDN